MHELNHEELLSHINKQTAKILWPELERAFAQGLVFLVDESLDLIEVAIAFIHDEAENIKKYMQNSTLQKVEDKQAQLWHQEQTVFWATVVTPWVLIQEVDAGGDN